MLKKFNLSTTDVTIRPIGESQPKCYNAMMAGILRAVPVTPPLDPRGKRDGFNVIYNLKELNLPFIYSKVHTNPKTIKERPELVQRFVAAMAESGYFAENNPDKVKASLGNVLKFPGNGHAAIRLRNLRGRAGQSLDARASQCPERSCRMRPRGRYQRA